MSAAELASLRQELCLRITLQNGLLILSVILLPPIAAIAIATPFHAWSVAFIHNCTMIASALQWCHHGVRTKQIKMYLLSIHSDQDGWERWLPANRPAGLLGSRWMISTKGVFLGLGMSSIILAVNLGASLSVFTSGITVIVWCMTAAFLFTNPKE